MPNVVVDANVVVSAALKPDSAPDRAFSLACGRDTLCLSTDVFSEYEQVLHRPKFDHPGWPERRDLILNVLLASGRFFQHREEVVICKDPKDDIYLELALTANANTIISGDRDLLALDGWRGIRILRPAQYTEQIIGRPVGRR